MKKFTGSWIPTQSDILAQDWQVYSEWQSNHYQSTRLKPGRVAQAVAIGFSHPVCYVVATWRSWRQTKRYWNGGDLWCRSCYDSPGPGKPLATDWGLNMGHANKIKCNFAEFIANQGGRYLPIAWAAPATGISFSIIAQAVRENRIETVKFESESGQTYRVISRRELSRFARQVIRNRTRKSDRPAVPVEGLQEICERTTQRSCRWDKQVILSLVKVVS